MFEIATSSPDDVERLRTVVKKAEIRLMVATNALDRAKLHNIDDAGHHYAVYEAQNNLNLAKKKLREVCDEVYGHQYKKSPVDKKWCVICGEDQ